MGNQAAPVPPFSPQQQQQAAVLQEQSQQQKQLMKLPGVNVCGGQCCHGWSQAQGSQRCIKRGPSSSMLLSSTTEDHHCGEDTEAQVQVALDAAGQSDYHVSADHSR
ncbi:hypothetical protein F2P81_020364 [Scophthalmus maximus]|uniref:Uncharacterized protein n=1 Tax=Scophthalmus maximus TaxID=52904 RepID=A0A6A4RZS8_SCOMX|nr:hypothetical protein F2P81_020364 [Scophthalmus maximus]